MAGFLRQGQTGLLGFPVGGGPLGASNQGVAPAAGGVGDPAPFQHQIPGGIVGKIQHVLHRKGADGDALRRVPAAGLLLPPGSGGPAVAGVNVVVPPPKIQRAALLRSDAHHRPLGGLHPRQSAQIHLPGQLRQHPFLRQQAPGLSQRVPHRLGVVYISTRGVQQEYRGQHSKHRQGDPCRQGGRLRGAFPPERSGEQQHRPGKQQQKHRPVRACRFRQQPRQPGKYPCQHHRHCGAFAAVHAAAHGCRENAAPKAQRAVDTALPAAGKPEHPPAIGVIKAPGQEFHQRGGLLNHPALLQKIAKTGRRQAQQHRRTVPAMTKQPVNHRHRQPQQRQRPNVFRGQRKAPDQHPHAAEAQSQR